MIILKDVIPRTIYFLKEKLWFGFSLIECLYLFERKSFSRIVIPGRKDIYIICMFSLIKSIFISLKENRGISLKISNAKIKVKAYLIKLYSYRKMKTVCFNKFSLYVFSNAREKRNRNVRNFFRITYQSSPYSNHLLKIAFAISGRWRNSFREFVSRWSTRMRGGRTRRRS